LVPADVHEIQELARKNREKGLKLEEKKPPPDKPPRAKKRARK
jgi:hypothetical protein